MKRVVLENRSLDGQLIQAVFLPEGGMNMISYQKGGIEVIDQSTKPLFEERYAGLGAIIGPHFHKRSKEAVPLLQDETIFPHIASEKKKGVADPFSHGIGRYVPWEEVVYDEHSIRGKLSSKNKYKSISLKEIEGMDFEMHFSAQLLSDGLHIHFQVESDKPSLTGLHYYYRLGGQAQVYASVKDKYNDQGVFKAMPPRWYDKEHHLLVYDLKETADYGFIPYTENAKIEYRSDLFGLNIEFPSPKHTRAWQLFHPENASFVCIEPLSVDNPRLLDDIKSELQVRIEILTH